ncbi:MAG TPA: hypothetical protein VFC80_04325 [Sphaerochaeta sp.]|nr:hypothetical protein [Sphaerochaeta sp.]
MSILQLILFAVLIPLTLFNFYFFTIGRKKRSRSQAEYQQILAKIERQAMEISKQAQLPFETQLRFLNDASQGILLAFDSVGELVGVFFDGSHHLFYRKDFLKAKQRWDQVDAKRITNISVEIETTEEVLTVIFGTKAYRPNSYLGKFILEDTQDFCTRINEHLGDRAKSQVDGAAAAHTESLPQQQ